MKQLRTQKGQSLVEILFAIAIFTIGVVTIGYLIIDSFASLDLSEHTQRAQLFASEGIEAVKLIQDEDFSLLAAGTHGLHFEEGWELQGESDEKDGFTRSVFIEDIEEGIKEVTVSVFWEGKGGEKELSLKSRISNWEQTGGESGRIQFDINDVQLASSSSEVVGLGIRNIGGSLVILETLSLAWESEALLEGVTIDSSVTSVSGGESGESIDVADYVFTEGAGFSLLSFDFSEDPGEIVMMSATFSDGSVKHVRINLNP
jgi:Tfp pilus assembly protein PilV